jgi:hypothetical protein
LGHECEQVREQVDLLVPVDLVDAVFVVVVPGDIVGRLLVAARRTDADQLPVPVRNRLFCMSGLKRRT